MSKIISKIEDLDGLQYYSVRIETLKTNQKVNMIVDGIIRQVYNLKTENITPYQEYTLEQIVLEIKNIYNFNIVYQSPIVLSLREIETCKDLKVLGYNWIARNENLPNIFAYKTKPFFNCRDNYYDGKPTINLNTSDLHDLFQFITFETGVYEIPNLD